MTEEPDPAKPAHLRCEIAYQRKRASIREAQMKCNRAIDAAWRQFGFDKQFAEEAYGHEIDEINREADAPFAEQRRAA